MIWFHCYDKERGARKHKERRSSIRGKGHQANTCAGLSRALPSPSIFFYLAALGVAIAILTAIIGNTGYLRVVITVRLYASVASHDTKDGLLESRTQEMVVSVRA